MLGAQEIFDIKVTAARLISEDGENPEYDRGIAELLVDIGGAMGADMDNRREYVLEELRAVRRHLDHA